ncbi:sulfoxide reductase heme-binding subunit YedZ [Chitinimonas arctica]|uniref:Protein-methionine-sulfoxide reductase heme-binding subunit MsrQ n=1 Tax=Chitinimonas arctica TaxID=2594795 RepID=A0A516SFG4_9NEIS|nr:protein-methionine-sulfoxide reductase heme-binding subunit MsrQ [Chitinimonas arctica]QDQ26899.1 sulfoxide reductase heme-binding subunit YedZ [Chitinimonas arctica]
MKPDKLSLLKIAVFILCLLPLARASWIVLSGQAINPIEFITRSLGTWTLVLLLLTLAITPLRKLSGRNELIKLRRMLGLFTFFYVLLHFLSYVWLDKFFDPADILKDIVKRPFITVGFAAFVLLIPLALTSTDAMMRRLKRNWGRLHKLVYPIAMLGVLHYWWLVKKDLTQPIIYACVLALLLGFRLWQRRIRRMPGD